MNITLLICYISIAICAVIKKELVNLYEKNVYVEMLINLVCINKNAQIVILNDYNCEIYIFICINI